MLIRDCAVPELLRVKHRIDARTARHETMAWIKRLRDIRRVAEKRVGAVRRTFFFSLAASAKRP